MSTITINSKRNTIEVSKAFADKASKFGSNEYELLKRAQSENPNCRVEIKATRTNRRNTLKGLTYEYMQKYILTHNKELLNDFLDMIGKSNNEFGLETKGAHYMSVKKWFLDNFPEIAEFETRAKGYKAA